MQPVITLSNVTKCYGSQRALDGVSFAVRPGVVFALLGENGAGKTTAIRLLLGLTDADEGSSTVLGLDSWSQGQTLRSRVGYVAERPMLYEWMTVNEIGWFTAGFYGSGFYKRYMQLVADYGLPPKSQIKRLSKGMRAKVALALALAHEPELLVLDEPTTGLDTLVRREFLEGMVDIAAAGRTVLLSSHQISEVERVADMIAILRAGKLLLVEPLDVLKDEIREVNVTLTDDSTQLPRVGGETLRCRRHRSQWQLLIRGLEDGEIDSLRAHDSVRELGVRTPTLEEIFVAYLKLDDDGGGAPAAAPEVTTP